MKKATKEQVLQMAIQQQHKYEELVWFARSGRNIHIPSVIKHRETIKNQFPTEIQQLQNENSDWTHGFNSGMLAGMRLITSMMDINIEHAIENFPELDT